MNKRRKSIIILLLVFATGIAAGVILEDTINKNKFRKMRSFSHHQGFVERLTSIIQPDEQQKTKIMPVLENTALQYEALNRLHKDKIRILFDSMAIELKPLLSQEQIKMFDEFIEQKQKRLDKNDSNSHRKR